MWKGTQMMLIDFCQSRQHISFYGNKIKPVRDRITVCSIGYTVLYLDIDCSFGKTLKICFPQAFLIDKKFQKIQNTVQKFGVWIVFESFERSLLRSPKAAFD